MGKISRSPAGLFGAVRRHPYTITVLICALLLPFGYADRSKITVVSCIYLASVAAAVSLSAVFIFKLGRNLREKAALCAICLSGIAAVTLILLNVNNKAVATAVIAPIAAALALLFIKLNYRLDNDVIIAALILTGIAIRFVYVLYTGSVDRQHDVGFFKWKWGHSNYIEYWYKSPFKLPDFDVRTIWQYYHPPLHHWLMAALLRLLTTLGVDYDIACEAIQMLPMLYSSLLMIVCCRIFRLIKLSGKPLIAATAIVCFHPTFILFSGAFNNDMLLMLFVTAAVMWGIRWFREPVMKNIIPLALCIGLGMMTKLSGWMAAPAVAFLFLYILIRNIKKPLRYIGQYAVFGVICVPLGLWWQVRNLLSFGVPLTYIPDLDRSSSIYVGDISAVKRLFDFSGTQLTYVYDAFTYLDSPYDEFNPTLGLFKTAVFDEGTNSVNDAHFPQITVTGPILFRISVVLFLCCFIFFIYMMIKKSKEISGAERIYFSLLFAVHLVSYYMFCFSYPFTCTMNIRYCMPLIPLCAMGLSMYLQRTADSKKPVTLWLGRVMYFLTAAFCVMSYVVYTQVGITI